MQFSYYNYIKVKQESKEKPDITLKIFEKMA